MVLVKPGDVQVLVHGGDVDFAGTGLAMAAIDAASPKLLAGGVEDFRVIPLFVPQREVGQGVLHLLRRLAARQNAGYRRAAQGIVDALGRGHGLAKGGMLRGEQLPRPQGLHHGDTHALLLAELVQRRPLGIDALKQPRVKTLVQTVQHVLLGRVQVVSHVDAEKHGFHQPRVHHPGGGYGIVGGKADMPDIALFLQALYILDKLRFKDLLVILLAVDEKHHAKVDVSIENAQQVLEIFADGGHVPADVVLLPHMGGPDMPLDHHVLAAVPQGLADVLADLLPGHKHVQQVHAPLQGRANGFLHPLIGLAIQVFAAQANDAGLFARASQIAVFHSASPFVAAQIPPGFGFLRLFL